MKTWFNRITTIILVIATVGLLYFIGHLLHSFGVFAYVWDNAIQLFCFYLIGVASGFVGMLFVPGERADESAYEAAIEDLKAQINDEENNNRMMRASNASYESDIQNKELLIKDLAEKLSLFQKLYEDCYIQLDAQRAEEVRKKNLSAVSIDINGKLR